MAEKNDTQKLNREAVDPESAGSALEKLQIHRPRRVPLLTVDLVCLQRSKTQEAKKKHRDSSACDMKHGRTCGACHFYSGAIDALSELVGEFGVID